MASHASATKRIRQTKRRTKVNRARRGPIRTSIRAVEEAIASGNKNAAAEALKAAEPMMAAGVSKGVFHRNTVARKLSRLSKRIKLMAA
ncbi:MAG: 30S ribosomal protein S20 [Rhodospirillaceae bacterium]